MSDRKEGPVWQIEQQMKSCKLRAVAHHEDARRSLKLAEQAQSEGEEYEKVFDILKKAGMT